MLFSWNFRGSLWCLIIVLIIGPCANSKDSTMLVATSWQNYLRLVPVSLHDGYTPLLFSDDIGPDRAITQFSRFYPASYKSLLSKDVDSAIEATWPKLSRAVICTESIGLGIFGAVIAARLDAPLFFTEDSLFPEFGVPDDSLVIIGADIREATKGIVLKDSISAAAFHNSLAENRTIAVLCESANWAFLAAEIAAYHKCPLILDRNEIRVLKPKLLAWVVDHGSVSISNVKDLYNYCTFTPGSLVPDVAIGIVTGLDATDVSLMLARTYTYHLMTGEWKSKGIIASIDISSEVEPTSSVPMEIYRADGNDLTLNFLDNYLPQVCYTYICAHGSQSRLVLRNGELESQHFKLRLAPQVFVAEACMTGDIAGGSYQSSIALGMISSGASAFIGSMVIGGPSPLFSYPFLHSTPSVPLAEHVRLANAMRLDFDATWSRGILIGEPSFHQFEDEFYDVKTYLEDGQLSAEITPRSDTGMASLVIELPSGTDVKYIVADTGGGIIRKYIRGPAPWHSPFSYASSGEAVKIMLEWPGGKGRLRFYESRPFYAPLLYLISYVATGLGIVFFDIVANPDFSPWFVVSIMLLFVLLYYLKRWLKEKWLLVVLAAASIGSALLSMLISFYYLSQPDFYLAFLFIAGTIITLSPFLSKIRRLRNRIFAAVSFAGVPVFASLFLLIMTGSMKVFLMALSASISVGLCYFLLLTLLVRLMYKSEKSRQVFPPVENSREGVSEDIKTQEGS